MTKVSMDENIQKKQVFVGEVVSNKMSKTLVVETERTFVHPQFHKTIRVKKKYKVHDEEGSQAHVGDIVEFVEGRPVSKTKYMYFVRVIQKKAL